MDNLNNNNWSFGVNLSGVTPAKGKGKALELPEGYYTATITDAYERAEKPGRVIFKLAIKDAPYTGLVRTTGINMPKSAEDNVRYYWRALLESAKFTPAQIDAGEVGMSRELLSGKEVTIHFVPGDRDAGVYEELQFLSPSDWAMQSQAFAAKATITETGTAPGGLGTPAVSVEAPTNGQGGISASSLRTALGMPS